MNSQAQNKFNVRKVLLNTILIFLAVNLVCFATVGASQLGKPYAKAKVVLTNALFINQVYCQPLSDITGYRSIVSNPCYLIRDSLYNLGLSFFPKAEGEREIWWAKIKLYDYKRYYSKIPTELNHGVRSVESIDLEQYWQKTDELYDHMRSMSSLSFIGPSAIKDPKQRGALKLNYILTAKAYFPLREISFHVRNNNLSGYLGKGTNLNTLYLKDDEEIKRIKTIYLQYMLLKGALKEEDSYTEVKNTKTAEEEVMFEFLISVFNLKSQVLTLKSIDCQSRYSALYAKAYKQLNALQQDKSIGDETQYVINNLLNKKRNGLFYSYINTNCSPNGLNK